MKEYCFDMSGLSNPLETMPEDIHKTMWARICEILASGRVAVTKEIYEEMTHIPGSVGDCILKHQDQLVLEVGQDGWDWEAYTICVSEMQVKYEAVISEFNGDGGGGRQISDVKKKIPEVCGLEDVEHCNFSDFLRREGIVI